MVGLLNKLKAIWEPEEDEEEEEEVEIDVIIERGRNCCSNATRHENKLDLIRMDELVSVAVGLENRIKRERERVTEIWSVPHKH